MPSKEQVNYLVRVFNTFFNPFEYENILSPPDPTPMRKALGHAGGLAMGYGGLAYVVRRVLQRKLEEKTTKAEGKMQDYVAARYPVIDVAPKITKARAKKLETLGVSQLPAGFKEAGLQKTSVSGAWSTAEPFKEVLRQTAIGPQDAAHLALVSTSGILAGYSGWRLADYVADRKKNEELDRKTKSAEKSIHKMVFDELLRTRSQKTAAMSEEKFFGQNPQLARGVYREEPETPSLITSVTPESAFKFGESLYWVWIALALAMSYKAAKAYTEQKDPARMRIKELKNLAAERAKVRDVPILLDVNPGEEMSGAKSMTSVNTEPKLPKALPKPKPVPQLTPAAETMPVQPEMAVDKTDPYAGLLK